MYGNVSSVPYVLYLSLVDAKGNEFKKRYAACMYGFLSPLLSLVTPFKIALTKYGVLKIDVVVFSGKFPVGDLPYNLPSVGR